MIYKDPADSSRHVITLNTPADGGDFDPTALYEPALGRLGYGDTSFQSSRGLAAVKVTCTTGKLLLGHRGKRKTGLQ